MPSCNAPAQPPTADLPAAPAAVTITLPRRGAVPTRVHDPLCRQIRSAPGRPHRQAALGQPAETVRGQIHRHLDATSTDTHRIEGRFDFRFHPEPWILGVAILLRGCHLLALASLFGSLVSLALVAPAALNEAGSAAAPARARLVRLARWSDAAALLIGGVLDDAAGGGDGQHDIVRGNADSPGDGAERHPVRPSRIDPRRAAARRLSAVERATLAVGRGADAGGRGAGDAGRHRPRRRDWWSGGSQLAAS